METVHIITMPTRKAAAVLEMHRHGINAVFWEGVTGNNPIKNINLAHKKIIQHAKDNNLPSILVAEDDCRWFGEPGQAFKYFLENRPKEDYSIYLSSYYTADKIDGFKIKNFCGLTMYECMASFYDQFLSVPDNRHIDRLISMTGGKFFVSPLFCTFQEPGYSFQRKRFADDSKRLENKPIFGK